MDGAEARDFEIRRDDGSEDPGWDQFLMQSSCGHFQQSALWSRVKANEGWRVQRATWRKNSQVAAGFQLLWRPSKLGNVGYVSKGPVCSAHDPDVSTHVISAMMEAARDLRLAALLVQPPDNDAGLSVLLERHSFVPDWMNRIVDATWMIDLTEGKARVQEHMRRTTRKTIRQSIRRGVQIRDGGEEDLSTFFGLMLETCKRQQTKPNPATETQLRVIWTTFCEKRCARLTLAVRDGACIAGLLSICFGDRITLWKKGTLPQHLSAHPMSLLYSETLDWAGASGFRIADFAAMKRGTAIQLLRGATLSDSERESRDWFNLGFGGYPVLLPPAFIWIRNPLLRFVNIPLSRLFATSCRTAPE